MKPNRSYSYTLAVAVLFILLAACSKDSSASGNKPGSWISATVPANNAQVEDTHSAISVMFTKAMNPASLNAENILGLDGKHGDANISSLFDYAYTLDTRTLTLEFKDPASDYGTDNGIQVVITGKVEGADKKPMNEEYSFGFSTGGTGG
ncbi:Ig-like domain-containing protein [Paenibacillus sp. NFR01]|uniref:Ig-like domain-containing protein n=1 Tax=Paenibacillus sp. NFR01 TaxID=1566279 RepID=UPI0008AAC751|nr:Ig-like domain-containing protein [Paenibacillus sp. NFR01]SEU15059.1 Ig-like domain-containing protein [Paenibacillus sp. NFR01]